MSHIIGSKCIGVKDGACILVCPIEDCIVEGEESMYINPETCIDCGACIYECPVEEYTIQKKKQSKQRALTNT